MISAFNSLTLSPALAALLIKPKAQAKREALPWIAYPILLGLLGYFVIGPMVEEKIGAAGAGASPWAKVGSLIEWAHAYVSKAEWLVEAACSVLCGWWGC